MSTIPQPLQDPSPSPEEILAGNNARMLQTVQQFGPAQAADRRYQFDREQALQAQRIQGEKDIAQWHERAAQIRSDAQESIWDKRIKAQAAAAAATEKTRLETVDQRELDKVASGFQTGSRDPKTGLYMPPIPQNPGESLRDYVVRAGTERAKHEAERDGTIEKNSQAVQDKMTGLLGDWDKQNQGAAHSSGVVAVNNFAQTLPTGGMFGHNVRKEFQETLQKNIAVPGTTYQQALAKTEAGNPAFAGASDAYTESSNNKLMALRAAKSPVLENQLTHLNGLLRNTGALANGDFKIPDVPSGPAGPATPLGPGGVNIGILRGGPGGASSAAASPQPNQFLPEGLRSPDALSLAAKYHPMGANLTQDPGDILGHAVAGARQKITQGQAALSKLGASVGPDGRLNVADSESRMIPAFGPMGVGSSPQMAVPLSPAERQQRYQAAQGVLQGMQQAKDDIGRLSALGNPAMSESAAADFGNEMSYPNPDQTLSGR